MLYFDAKYILTAIAVFLALPVHQTQTCAQEVTLKELTNGWRQYASLPTPTYSYKHKTTSNSKLVINSTYWFSMQDEKTIVKMFSQLDNSQQLCAENADYVFQVIQPVNQTAFNLEKMEFQVNRTGSDGYSRMFELYTYPGALYFWPNIKWDLQLNSEFAKIGSIQSDPQGGVDLEFDVDLGKDISRGGAFNSTQIKAKLGGPPYYLPQKYSFVSSAPELFNTVISLDYAEIDGVQRLMKKRVVSIPVDVNSEFGKQVEEYEYQYDISDFPESDFRLSAYGLPEPGVKPKQPWGLSTSWILLLAGITAVFVGAFLLLRKNAA